MSAAIKVVMLAGIACAGFFIAAHGAAITPHAFVATPCPDVASALRGGGAGFAAALLGASYAFGGWSNITAIAGEIREPTRTLPRAMTGAVLLVIALYAVANAAFVRTIGFEAIRHVSPQSSLGIVVAEALFGSGWATISSALLCVSIAATLHVAILGTSRTTFALAKDGLIFPALARLSPSGVPQLAVLGTSTLAIVLVTLMGFERLSNYYVFNSWLILALTVVGLIVLRRREPTAPRPYRTVGYPFVPVAYLVAVSYVLVVTVISNPNDAVIGIAIALSGIPAYAVIARAKRRRANAANASLAPDVP